MPAWERAPLSAVKETGSTAESREIGAHAAGPILVRVITLASKDYLTVPEAAEYACISVSHWRARVQPEFPPGEFCGKLIYRKADVARYIEMKVRWPGAKPEPSFIEPQGQTARRRSTQK